MKNVLGALILLGHFFLICGICGRPSSFRLNVRAQASKVSNTERVAALLDFHEAVDAPRGFFHVKELHDRALGVLDCVGGAAIRLNELKRRS